MYGIGVPELLVITLIVALLFGAPILTFFVGYLIGRHRATTPASGGPATPAPPSPVPAPPQSSQPATPEEPADE